MKLEEFKNMIRQVVKEELSSILEGHTNPSHDHLDPHKDPHLAHEEICEGEGCLDEKSVPEPYNRKSPPRRPMTKSQIAKRKRIGKSMENNEKIKSQFMKDYGDDWRSYIWAAATSATFREKNTTKADDKKKK